LPVSGFNPRARTGRDRAKLELSAIATFQSTRPHGARLLGKWLSPIINVSIHAPARGATETKKETVSLDGFNPRARTGRDGKTR